MEIGDKVRYQGFEATVEAIDPEESAFQYRLGSFGIPGAVIFTHPQHPGWGFPGTSEEWANSGVLESDEYLNWPSSFEPTGR